MHPIFENCRRPTAALDRNLAYLGLVEILHGYPIDCSRWTELGLKHFLAECGFPIEDFKTGSWGNRASVKASFRSNGAADVNELAGRFGGGGHRKAAGATLTMRTLSQPR